MRSAGWAGPAPSAGSGASLVAGTLFPLGWALSSLSPPQAPSASTATSRSVGVASTVQHMRRPTVTPAGGARTTEPALGWRTVPAPPPARPPTGRPPAGRHLPPDEFDRWYGGWDPLDPTTVAAFMEGFDRPWWIIDGWSLEVFTGVSRRHEDMDISILSCDAEAFRRFLGDAWTPWNVDNGWFRPFDARFTDVRPHSQVWVRRDATSPWVLDVPFTPHTDGRWTNKRNLAHTEELDDVTWTAHDGLRYARPEVALMFKAGLSRSKDRADAKATIPMLDRRARAWLRDAVARMDPDHEWVRSL